MKKENGITLVALVVTIIVLLILAGVSLSMVFSQDGIFQRAENAANKWNAAAANEATYLNNFENKFYSYYNRYDTPAATNNP